MPDQIIFRILITVASMAFQQAQHNKLKKKMEAEADKRKGFMIPTRGEAAHIPVVYGKQAVGGTETRHITSNNFNNYTNNSDKTFSEEFDNTSQSGSKNEFLFVQSALCHGNIHSVESIYVNDSHYDEEKAKFNHRFSIHYDGGTADAMATANGFATSDKFTNCAFVTAAYKLNRDDPQYSGLPAPLYLVKGKKVRPVNLSGSNYSLGGYSYSNNPALCLLDYLLDSKYGRGLNSSEVDLPSFYHAMQVCNTTVTTRIVGGRINGVDPIASYSTFNAFPNEGKENVIYKAEDTGYFYKWDTTQSPDIYVRTTVNTQAIPLYECNITLDTEATLRDNIEKIMNTMGLAELVWSSEGKYKLLLEYPSSQTALNNLVNSSHIFNENNIVRENVSISWPPAADRLNQSTVTFINEFEDFKQDSETWPPTGSSVHNTYLTEDNNQPFTTDVNLEGITDPYHARARAEQLVRQSREIRTIAITLDKSALSLEPGDFIKLNSDNLDISNEIFRTTSVTVNSDLSVEVEAYLFTINMLAWNIDDDIAYAQRPVFDFTLDDVSNITTTPGFFVNNDGSLTHYIDVTWDHDGSFSYEIRYKKSTEPFSSYISVSTRLKYYRILNIEQNTTYNVQVRAISSLGTGSGFITVNDANNGKNTAPAAPTNLSATGVFEAIELNWTNPVDKDLKTIQIWESSNSSINNATLIGTSGGSNFRRGNLDISQTKYYWVRAEDTSGNLSSYTGPVNATTTFIDDDAFETGIRDLFEDQGLYAIEDVASLPSTGAIGQQLFNRADGKLYRWDGTAWVLVVAAVEAADIDGILSDAQVAALAASKITGQLTNAQLADIAAAKISGQLTNAQLADIAATKITGQLTNAQLDDIAATKITGQLTNAQLDDIAAAKITGQLADSQLAAISSNKISGQLTDTQIADVAAAKLTGQITETQISDNAITTAKINAGAINADKIAANTITASEIAANAVTANEIAANAVTANKITANAITSAKINAGAITAGKIAADAVTADKVAANAIEAASIAAGAITAGKIAADAVTANEIAANAVTAATINAGAITAAKIAADAVTADKVAANAITAASISAGAITAAKIAADAVTADKVAANAITAASIAAGAVNASKIAANSITAGQLAANSVTASEIAANAVTASEIAGNTITGNKIVANTITGGLLATSGVITNSAQINNGLITNAKIDNGAITNAKISNAQITAAKIADGNITNAKIANAAITNAKINDLNAVKITAGTISAGRFVGSGIVRQTSLKIDYTSYAAGQNNKSITPTTSTQKNKGGSNTKKPTPKPSNIKSNKPNNSSNSKEVPNPKTPSKTAGKGKGR